MNFNPIVNAGVALELEVDRILDPARFWDSPEDVAEDPFLSATEKKSILASWASDVCAVESNPTLRQNSRARSPASFEVIMDAMKKVDAELRKAPAHAPRRRRRSSSSSVHGH